MRKHTRKQHERVSIFNTPGPLDEWSAATSIAEHLTLRPSRFQVGSSRGALLTDPPKLRITLRCLLEVLRNETTARRGGPGSFDGVEERCSGLKSAAEVRIEVPGNARASPSDRRAMVHRLATQLPVLRLLLACRYLSKFRVLSS